MDLNIPEVSSSLASCQLDNDVLVLKRPEYIRLVPDDWSYMGEGNANILFAYNGGSAELRGWLLRLTKCDCVAGSDTNIASWSNELRIKSTNVIYACNVIGPLLGPEYILPQRLVALEKGFLCNLMLACEPLRPAHRTHRHIDVERSVGVLTLNQLLNSAVNGGSRLSQSVTVELKPKWGFMPSANLVSPQNAVKSRTCRYCMHQLTKHGVPHVSSFCPLDLFSKTRCRVVQALDSLAQSPQNNMRLFVNGQHVVDGSGKISETCLPEWLALRDCIADIVIKEPLFTRLGNCQRMLDSLDIEGVLPRYERAVHSGLLASTQPTLNDWVAAATAFSLRANDESAESVAIDDKQSVLEFLMSTTLKDVSVLITFPEWPATTIAQPIGTTAKPHYNIAVIDLDPKDLSKITHYHAKDQKIVTNYLAHYPNTRSQRQCGQ